jgi:hypothetical protein
MSFVFDTIKKKPSRPRWLPGQVRRRIVCGPSCIGGILPIVYLLATRPTDPENPEMIRRLPRDLLRTIGPSIPYTAFLNGALRPPVRIWRIRGRIRGKKYVRAEPPSTTKSPG